MSAMRTLRKFITATIVLSLFAACADRGAEHRAEEAPQPPAQAEISQPPLQEEDGEYSEYPPAHIPDGRSLIFVQQTTGVDDGVARLVRSMRENGLPFHQTQGAEQGLIAQHDVVLLKINAQWAERGGTNTDLIRGVIQAVLEHPDGFSGEIIVADNGQAQFGSAGAGGSLDWPSNNAVDVTQSVMRVVGDFREQGYRVTGVLWDNFTRTRVSEFSEGDYTDGFVVEDERRATGLEISYPKFTTEFGTHVSFREGIWNPDTGSYERQRLKVINMPVLKSHQWLQVTGVVKNYMGVPSDMLTGGRAHRSVATGGMGTMMAHTRMPVLNILDMIWIGTERGPANPHSQATQTNLIAASTDPIALDYWATRHVLIPAAEQRPGARTVQMDPAGDYPGTFGHWLRLSKYELHSAGYNATMDESYMRIIGWE